ncbi:hypothetical protein [Brachybacterium vulturis]|uniref:hypothetical protein n=1 Tax=Brachybacterium vulturis TaxID=2017484 RepID=UPI0037368D5C
MGHCRARFIGVFTALFAVALLVRGELLSAVLVVLLGLLAIAAGVALFLLARRAAAHLEDRGVAWSTMFGARGVVLWEQVQQVVPAMHEPGEAVLLRLRDGSVVPIAPLRKTQSVDDSTGAHPWYLRAGAAVVRAHQQWLAQNPPQGR